MKFILVFAVLLVAFFVWRSNRTADRPPPSVPRRDPAPKAGASIEMVRCASCGLHLPSMDAVQGRRGWYCCALHRQQSETG